MMPSHPLPSPVPPTSHHPAYIGKGSSPVRALTGGGSVLLLAVEKRAGLVHGVEIFSVHLAKRIRASTQAGMRFVIINTTTTTTTITMTQAQALLKRIGFPFCFGSFSPKRRNPSCMSGHVPENVATGGGGGDKEGCEKSRSAM